MSKICSLSLTLLNIFQEYQQNHQFGRIKEAYFSQIGFILYPQDLY